MEKYNKYIVILIVVVVLIMSIGYSVLNKELSISGEVNYRPQSDVRITKFTANDKPSTMTIEYSDFSKHQVKLGYKTTASCSITYTIEVTNYSAVSMGIVNIKGLDNNVEVQGGIVGTKLFGAGETMIFTITFNSLQAETKTYLLTFEFERAFNITYEDFFNTEGFQKEILKGDTFKFTIKEPFPVGAKPFYDNTVAPYNYNVDTLIVENVTGDLTIKSNYIQSIEDLVALSNLVNEGKSFENKTIILEKDLDFNEPNDYRNSNRTDFGDINGNSSDESLLVELKTESGWKPIGTTDLRFNGIFDGKDHTIKNIYINNKTESASVGLFGAIENATISNLNLYGEIKTEVNANMGAVSGRAHGKLTIDNIENHVNIMGVSKTGSNGGIFGSTNTNVDLTLSNSKNYGNISYGNQAGGFIAWFQGKATIENCHNYGNMTLGTGSNDDGLRAGGIIGAFTGSTSAPDGSVIVIKKSTNEGTISSIHNSGGILGIAIKNNYLDYTIENCNNSGSITGGDSGGIVGYSDNRGKINIYRSENTGDITGSANSRYVGGILGCIGTNESTYTIENCNNSGSIEGYASGGIVGYGYSGEIIINKCANTGNITSSEENAGGILGRTDDGAKILNCYNSALITAENAHAGGIIGGTSVGSDHLNIVVNSYNIGEFRDKYAAGIIYGRSYSSTTTTGKILINNCYNAGELNSTYRYGLIYIPSNYVNGNADKIIITNSYYDNRATDDYGIPKSLEEMRNQAFVNILNKNRSSIDLEKIDSSLADYTLSEWELGTNGFPTLKN